MEAFTTRLCLRAADQYERLLQAHFNKVRASKITFLLIILIILIQNTLEIEIYSNYEKFRWCINCSRIFVQIYGPSTIYNIIFNRW